MKLKSVFSFVLAVTLYASPIFAMPIAQQDQPLYEPRGEIYGNFLDLQCKTAYENEISNSGLIVADLEKSFMKQFILEELSTYGPSGKDFKNGQPSVSVSEPRTMLLLSCGLFGLVVLKKRRQAKE